MDVHLYLSLNAIYKLDLDAEETLRKLAGSGVTLLSVPNSWRFLSSARIGELSRTIRRLCISHDVLNPLAETQLKFF